jgi:hypothetical protein
VLLLSGCTPGEDIAIQTPPESGEVTVSPSENPEPIDYSAKWENAIPANIMFPRGTYSFTYDEKTSLSGIQSWSGEGRIGFYEDGSCAFDFSGTKINYDGEEIDYRIIKQKDSYPMLRTSEYAGVPTWTNDPMLIAYSYRTNYPAMGAFPRYKDYSSFCAMQKISEISERGGAEFGYFFWDRESGAKFASEGKEWYYDFMLTQLKIDKADYSEATEILDLMFYGNDNIFTYDGQGKVETSESGLVTISTGLEKEDSSLISRMILTPSDEELLIELSAITDEIRPVDISLTLEAYIESYGSGIEYLRETKRLYDEYPAKSN